MTLTATTQHRSHGELDCADAEAILHETTLQNADLRARLSLALETQATLEHHLDSLRLDTDRLRALLADLTAKNTDLANDRDGLAEQVKLINDELAALEADAVPPGSLLFAALTREEMVAEYRRASRINRGPLPPAVTDAIDAAREDIIEAMTTTGREALTAVIRREVRRRRRAQNRTTTGTRRAATGTRR